MTEYDIPWKEELQFRDTLKSIEMEKNMPYVTSVERLARDEGKIEGKIQLLQDLLGIPIASDKELESMTAAQLEVLYLELRERVKTK